MRLEIANLEREIAHMEADLAYHRNQLHAFETKIGENPFKV